MYGVSLLIIVALMSLLVTRVATVALTATGMARVSARFQARSALSGVGFTTAEAESVVNHPARRRIIMALMLIGNVGLVTAVAGLLGSFLNTPDIERGTLRALLLVGGLGTVYALSKSNRVDRLLSRHVAKLLERYSDIDVRDYAALLHVGGDYAVKEVTAHKGSWLTQHPLGELHLRDEGVIVLGIVRVGGEYEGAPDKGTRVDPGDMAVLYGRSSVLADVAARREAARDDRAARGEDPNGAGSHGERE